MEQIYFFLKLAIYIVGPVLIFTVGILAYKLLDYVLEISSEERPRRKQEKLQQEQMAKEKLSEELQDDTPDKSLDDDDEEPQGMPGRKREIFRYTVDGHAVDQVKLYKWINTHFVPRITKAYEWFALWRVLRDKKLFEEGQDKAQGFADQMNSWFPDAAVHCSAGEVNRFKRGYLGSTPHTLWEKGAFLRSKEEKQTTDGYNNLDKLCSTLEESFSWKALEP